MSEGDVKDFGPYLNGNVSEAWTRCLPFWLNSSWRDIPRAYAGKNYRPSRIQWFSYWESSRESFETKLGRRFVERFTQEHSFLLKRYYHGSVAEQLCVFDLLQFLAKHLYWTDQPLPDDLQNCQFPLLEITCAEIEFDRRYNELPALTLGSFLEYEHNCHLPPGIKAPRPAERPFASYMLRHVSIQRDKAVIDSSPSGGEKHTIIERIQKSLSRFLSLGPPDPKTDLVAIKQKLKRAVPIELHHGETKQERKVEWSEIETCLNQTDDSVDRGAMTFFAEVFPGDEIFEVCSEIGAAARLASYHRFEIRRNGKVIDSWTVFGS